MADNPEPIQVSIIAEIKGLMDGLGQATSGVKSATEEMGKSFSGLAQTITNLKAPFMALTGLLAGGAIFKGAIDETINWAGEVKKLSMAMGVNMEQASAWAVAMHTIGISQDTMVGIMQKLQMRVQTGAKAFEAYGIQTKAANGAILPTADILQNVTAKYQSMGSQTEKNAMLAALFGRSWMQVQQVMKITAERLADAAKEAKDFGLEVDDKGVAQARNYKEALNKISLVGLSLANMVGQQLLPMLTSIGQWFGGKGAQAVYGFGLVLKALATVFYELKMVVEVIASTIASFVAMAITRFETLGEVVNLAVHGKFKEIPGAFNAMGQSIAYQQKAYADEVKSSWDNAAASMLKVWDKASPGKGGSDAPAMPGPDMGKEKKGKKDSSRVSQWDEDLKEGEAALSRMQAQNGQFYEKDLATELDYWKRKLQSQNLSDEERLAVQKKITDLELETDKQGLDKKKAALDTEIAAAKNNLLQKRALAVQELAMYAEGSTGYEHAQRKIIEIDHEITQQKMTLDKLALAQSQTLSKMDLQDKINKAREAEQQGLISKTRMIQIERDTQEQIYQIEHAAAVRYLADLANEPVKYQEEKNKILQMERQHQQEMATLTRQETQSMGLTWQQYFQKMQTDTQQFAQKFRQSMQQAVSQVNAGVGNAFGQMIVYGKSFGQSMKEMAGQILSSFISMCVQMALQWIESQILMAIFGKSTQTTAGEGQVSSNAAVGASAAEAATAAIPIVGPELAPAAGMAMYASILGTWGPLASAAGGWDRVPSDQLAAIHKNEMVLSSPLATGLRNMIANGGGNAGGGITHLEPHFHGVIDAASFYKRSQGDLVACIKDAAKNRRG